MCFSGGEPEPWWMQYRAENDAAPPADELDAGADPEPPCPPEMVLVEGSYCPDTRSALPALPGRRSAGRVHGP